LEKEHPLIKQEIMSAYNSHASDFGYHTMDNQYGLPNPPSPVDELNFAGRNSSATYPSHIGNHIPTGTTPSSIPAESYGNFNPNPSATVYGFHAVPDDARLRMNDNHGPVDNAHLPDNPYLPDDARLHPTANHGPADYSSSFSVDESLDESLDDSDVSLCPSFLPGLT
jgi:hypothetical protein